MGYYNHYSKWHNHNDAQYVRYMKRKYKNMFGNELPISKDAAILEIGCANGIALATLKEMGYSNLLGIELDEELAQVARSFLIEVRIQNAIDFVNETNGKYDFIYLFDVLEHFEKESIPKFLGNLYNILKPGGTLLMVVPNATSPAGSYFRYIDWTHHISFTPSSISYLLEEAGFKKIVISEESLVELPRREDFESESAFKHAKRLSDRARFFESFARWELVAQFGQDPYSLLVTPNMRVVSKKVSPTSNIPEINIVTNEDLFDLFEHTIETANIDKEIVEIRKEISQSQESLVNYYEDKLEQIHNVQHEYLDRNHKLNNEVLIIQHKIEEMTLEKNNLLIAYTRVELKKRKKIWRKLLERVKAYKHRKLIKDSSFFDSSYYLESNPDVAHSGCDPILHYLLYGSLEGRNPSRKFNTLEYIKKNPDVLFSNINPLIHKILSSENKLK